MTTQSLTSIPDDQFEGRLRSGPTSASFIGGSALLSLIYFGWIGTREWEQAISIGILGVIVFQSLRWMWVSNRSGRPIATVFARRTWPGFLLTIALALVAYGLTSYLAIRVPWATFVLSLVFLALIARTYSYFVSPRLELRAEGVLLPHAFYYPWKKVRVLEWRPERGQVLLKCGWHRIVMFVQANRFEALRDLITERLSATSAIQQLQTPIGGAISESMTVKHDLVGAMSPTDVRFSIRAILILMTVAAIGATAIGAVVRLYPENARGIVALFWISSIAMLAAIAGFVGWQRYGAEKRVGMTLYCLTPHSYLMPRAPRLVNVTIGVLLISASLAVCGLESVRFATPSPAWNQLDGSVIYAIALAALGITYLWWNRDIRVGENGVLVRNRFLPWENLTRWYWDACNRGVAVLEFQRPNASHGKAVVKVAAADLSAFEALLTEKRSQAKALKPLHI